MTEWGWQHKPGNTGLKEDVSQSAREGENTWGDLRVPPVQEIKRGWQTTTLRLRGTIRKFVSMEKDQELTGY